MYNSAKWGEILIRKKYLLCFLFITVILTGCSRVEYESSLERFQADYMEVFGGSSTKTQAGDFQVREGLIYFTDYNTQTCIPMCSKPNCRHLSEYEDKKTTCNAVCDGGLVFPYDGRLYRIIREGANQESKLIATDMDGSNPKEVGSFYSGDMLSMAVIVENKMYYVCLELKETAVKNTEENQDADHMPDMELIYMLNALDLDTLEQEQIIAKSGVQNFILLGGTKDYQVYAVSENKMVEYYLFDYETKTSRQIFLNTNDYRKVTVAQDGESFYYAGDEGKKIYCYTIENDKNTVAVDATEIETGTVDNIGQAGEKIVYAEAVCEEGLLFRLFPQNELYLKNGNEISNLKLSQRLKNNQAWLAGIDAVTETGIYFSYQAENMSEADIDGDLLMWHAYIDKKDLFNESGDIKVIHTPRVSSAGNIVNITD